MEHKLVSSKNDDDNNAMSFKYSYRTLVNQTPCWMVHEFSGLSKVAPRNKMHEIFSQIHIPGRFFCHFYQGDSIYGFLFDFLYTLLLWKKGSSLFKEERIRSLVDLYWQGRQNISDNCLACRGNYSHKGSLKKK